MTMPEWNPYSQYDSSQSRWFLFSVSFLCPIGLILTVIILFLLYHQKHEVGKYKRSFRFAIISITCSLLLYSIHIIIGSNLLFPWNFDIEHQIFATVIDALFMSLYAVGKVTFYASFTYHVLNAFGPQSKARKYLNIWVVIGCIAMFSLIIGYVIDNALEVSSKEIGVTSPHNIHFIMFVSHDGADISQILTIVAAVVDVIYFFVLLYTFIKQLKKENSENSKELKGLVLICYSCITFWIQCVLLSIRSPAAWLYSFDLLSDDICLFLMFDRQDGIYRFWCSKCHSCWSNIVYGTTQKYKTKSHSNDESENQQDEELLIQYIESNRDE
eukprot:152321_1